MGSILTIAAWAAGVIAAIVGLLVVFWKAYFLRKPERKIPKKGIVSPANGKVVKIIDFSGEKANVEKGLLGKVKVMTKDVAQKGKIIVIMMTPFNVHYQRAPLDGEVVGQKHEEGKLLNAVKGAEGCRASFENEKNTITIKSGKMTVKVVQVAGFLARRIESYVKVKQKIHKGQTIGRINLGSQVLLVIPEMKIRVKEGDTVVDGETIIAG
ncbi:TPA: phosphatidylserine decarboxylase family protein [Candidatus Woesearchaeota archaeon]|nr:phosphatidylserine decarboxylase family protein [Candidatus Woesearchaeota archaeon]